MAWQLQQPCWACHSAVHKQQANRGEQRKFYYSNRLYGLPSPTWAAWVAIHGTATAHSSSSSSGRRNWKEGQGTLPSPLGTSCRLYFTPLPSVRHESLAGNSTALFRAAACCQSVVVSCCLGCTVLLTVKPDMFVVQPTLQSAPVYGGLWLRTSNLAGCPLRLCTSSRTIHSAVTCTVHCRYCVCVGALCGILAFTTCPVHHQATNKLFQPAHCAAYVVELCMRVPGSCCTI